MSGPALRVGILGGVPPSLGAGGLEVQVARTAAALSELGHEVRLLPREPEPWAFDVLHAFSSGPDVAHQLAHWRRSTAAPLVVSPVMVVPPGLPELRQLLAHRLPLPEFGPRHRALLLRRADAVVALTRHEARLLARLRGRAGGPIVVVGNGVDRIEPAEPPPGLPDSYVALVGSVGARKRQLPVLAALAASGGPAPVVAGGPEPGVDPATVERAVASAGGVWLGDVADPSVLRTVIRGARALVHLSAAEGQSLAVLEALAEGTPVVLAPLASSHELQAAHPGWVALASGVSELPAALEALAPMGPAPAIESWAEVAVRLDTVYRTVGAGPAQ